MPLTKRIIDAAECPVDKAKIIVWDGEIPGYGLAVYASGRKAYVMKYTIAGRQRWHTIGQHGPLTPKEAEKRAKKARVLVDDGIDPAAERQRERESRTTVAELADAGRRARLYPAPAAPLLKFGDSILNSGRGLRCDVAACPSPAHSPTIRKV